MKTQILQLEPHDDVISTRDKMGWGQANRVVLVWPQRGRILNRRLDLVLLQRHSMVLGSQLALVTRDADVRFHASLLRIPVFNSLKDAQDHRWRVTRRRKIRVQRSESRPDFTALRLEAHPPSPAWLEYPVTRLVFFSLGVLAFLSVVFVLLPGAHITLSPRTQIQETTMDVAASPSISSLDISGNIPAQYKTIVVEGIDQVPSNGTTQVPEGFANGYARFSNLTNQDVAIPKGTIISSLSQSGKESIQFATTIDGRTQAGIGGYASLPVRALVPGTSGNLAPDSLVAIDGPLGLTIEVSNTLATSGGTARAVRAPSLVNYNNLYDRLVTTLKKSALEELKTTLSPGDLPVTSTLTLSQTLEKTYDPPLINGASSFPADQLSLTLRLEFRILVVPGAQLREMAARVLDVKLPKNTSPLADTLQIKNLAQPKLENNSYRWRIHIRRSIQSNLHEDQAVKIALGLPQQQASLLLSKSLPWSSPPEIRLIPSWWPRLPVLPIRMQVTIKVPAP
ncbi:MAG: baseplate J/gp47 family protein [Omnitrophica WOR_2 bacterium]